MFAQTQTAALRRRIAPPERILSTFSAGQGPQTQSSRNTSRGFSFSRDSGLAGRIFNIAYFRGKRVIWEASWARRPHASYPRHRESEFRVEIRRVLTAPGDSIGDSLSRTDTFDGAVSRSRHPAREFAAGRARRERDSVSAGVSGARRSLGGTSGIGCAGFAGSAGVIRVALRPSGQWCPLVAGLMPTSSLLADFSSPASYGVRMKP